MITDQHNDDDEQHEATTSSSTTTMMNNFDKAITIRDRDDRESCTSLYVNSALTDHEYDRTFTITLPMWRWMAISALAEDRGITSKDLVARWIDQRLDSLSSITVHLDPG